MIKALFFDIDGTLVSFRTHTVPASVIEAIHRVREQGVKVFIATGRPLPFVNNLGDLETDGIMTVNGACCMTADGTLIRHDPVDKADLQRLIERYHQTPFPIAFAANDEVFITPTQNDESQQVFDLLALPVPHEAPIEHCLEMNVMQVIAFFPAEEQEEIMTNVLSGCDAQRWHPFFTDVIRRGNNKANGIDTIIRHYGIDLSETMAFGDGGNDIDMLRHAAIGVAMGNAREEVKQAADYVTDSVDNDGIAKAINHFFNIN